MKVVRSALALVLIITACNQEPKDTPHYMYQQVVSDNPILNHVIQDIDTGSIYRVGFEGDFKGFLKQGSGKLRGFDLKDSLLAWTSDSIAITVLNINTQKQRIINLPGEMKLHHDIVIHYPYITALFSSAKMKRPKDIAYTNEGIVKIDIRNNERSTWMMEDFLDKIWLPDTLDALPLNSHSNSVEIDEAGSYYVSFRNLSQVWKISSDLSTLVYTVGMSSQFNLTKGDYFVGQHSIDIVRPDEFFLFDNGSIGTKRYKSRIVRVKVFPDAKTFQVNNILSLPDTLGTVRMGSAQALGDRITIGVHNLGFHVVEIDTSGNVHNHLFYEKAHAIKVLPELSKE